MQNAAPSRNSARAPRGEIVQRPRVTDAIGASLRDTFASGEKLPTDWLAALERLDTIR